MSYYSTEPPDPGTVKTDDRCWSCSAKDGEPCVRGCLCGLCLKARSTQARRAAQMEMHLRRRQMGGDAA